MWTEENTKLCVKLWNEGLSASQVAQRISGATRNSVIGKIHRLGLSNQREAPRLVVRKPRKAKRKPLNVYRHERLDPSKLRIPRYQMVVHDLPPEPPKPDVLLSLVEITDREEAEGVKLCRFIYGDPREAGSGYCGCEAAPGSSYCAGHHALMFTAPVPKSRGPIGKLKRNVVRFSNAKFTRKAEVVW